MASFVKYQQFVEDLGNKVHDFVGTNDTLKVMLSNAAPNVSTHALRSDVTELSTTGGYTSGGEDVQNDGTEATGTLTVHGVAKPNTMPVTIERIADRKLKVTGTTSVKMTDHGIKPPSPPLIGGLIKTGDEVKITFEWVTTKK